MDILQLGPLTIKYNWLFLFISGFITYLILNKKLTNPTFKKEFTDVLFNTVFILIIVFKFSIILFRPSLLLDNPLAILYFNGGTKGMIIASIVALSYLFWKKKKLYWKTPDFMQGIIYTFISFAISYWSIRTVFYIIMNF